MLCCPQLQGATYVQQSCILCATCPSSRKMCCRDMQGVKNGFSDPTKVQKGRDRQRKDVEGDRQGKALKEGCHERRWARTGVSSREEINTNRDLARVTTKSKSGTQTVSDGRVGRRVKNQGV